MYCEGELRRSWWMWTWRKNLCLFGVDGQAGSLVSVCESIQLSWRPEGVWLGTAASSAYWSSYSCVSGHFSMCLEPPEIKHILPSRRYLNRMPPSVDSPLLKTSVTATRKRLKITGARTHPCLTPAKTSNGSDSWPPMVTLAFIPSWNSRRMVRKWGGQPNLLRTFHSRSLFTVSNALVRSMKAKNSLQLKTVGLWFSLELADGCGGPFGLQETVLQLSFSYREGSAAKLCTGSWNDEVGSGSRS